MIKKIFWLLLIVLGMSFIYFSKPFQHPFSLQKGGPQKVLHLAIWTHYISPAILEAFEAKTGIRVELSHFSSNEELLAKIQAGASGYDVIFPSDYMVVVMKKLNLLQPLDLSQIPHIKKIDPRILKKAYDPENQFAVPYSWGTTGIAIRTDLMPKGVEIKGWKDLFFQPRLAGKWTLLDDAREVIGAALKVKGLSSNTIRHSDLNEAKALLISIKQGIRAFTSETKVPLIRGEFVASQAFSIDALQANQETQGKVRFILPEEGGTLWIDNLAIPRSSRYPLESHQLIQFLLEKENSAHLTQALLIAPAHSEAITLLPRELQLNTTLFPAAEALSRCEMIEDLGQEVLYWDRIWTEFKAAD